MHIPFWVINVDESLDRSTLEEELRMASEHASSSVGALISMGNVIESPEFYKQFHDKFMKLARTELPGLHYRVHKSYALLLSIAESVRDICILTIHISFVDVCKNSTINYFNG